MRVRVRNVRAANLTARKPAEKLFSVLRGEIVGVLFFFYRVCAQSVTSTSTFCNNYSMTRAFDVAIRSIDSALQS